MNDQDKLEQISVLAVFRRKTYNVTKDRQRIERVELLDSNTEEQNS